MPSLSSPRKFIPRTPCIVHSLIENISNGNLKQAVDSLEIFRLKGLRLKSKTLAFLIRQCGNFRSLKEGKRVHLHLKITGLKRPVVYISNHLINMYFDCGDSCSAQKVFDEMRVRNLYTWNNLLSGYAKLGRMESARKLFDEMPERDVVSWNSLLMGSAKLGSIEDALRYYWGLSFSGIGYNEFTFAGVLTVCVEAKEVVLTKQVHGQVFVLGYYLSNIVVSSMVVDAYAKCGKMEDARRVFDEMAVKDVHAWTTLLSGYAKQGYLNTAKEIFDQMPEKNTVSWNSLIAGYARNGQGEKALDLLTEMMALYTRPDQFTFSSCLYACASFSLLKHGKQIHAYLIRAQLRLNTVVTCSLIDMYAKCGDLRCASLVFELLGDKQQTALWNTMISALAQHGRGKNAVELFDDMVSLGVKPDRITLVAILNACSYSGLFQEGLRLFLSMTCDHKICMDQEHYACMVDLLRRVGHSYNMVNMPFPPDDQAWNTLLETCKIYQRYTQ